MKREEHWVVEKSLNMVLVIGDEPDITIKNFTHLENTGGFGILTPEVFGDFGNRVNTDTVEIESRNYVTDP